MPFGMAPAPTTWTKTMRPVVQHMRKAGFRIFAYVEEFGGTPPADPGQPATTVQAWASYQ